MAGGPSDDRARRDQRVAQGADAGARLGGQRGDGGVEAAERNDLAGAGDGQADGGEADPAAREALAISEPRRGDGDAGGQSPASSADIATWAMACSVVSTAAVAAWSIAAAACP